MKPIYRTKTFNRHYKKRVARSDKLKQALRDGVESFLQDRASVDDHQLEGKMGLFRAFSITKNYRVVYTETPEYLLFQDVGTHQQVYKR